MRKEILIRLIALCCFATFITCEKKRDLTIVESNIQIVDANSQTTEGVGLETLGGVFTPLITKGTNVPFEVSEIFSTAVDNQDQILISIYRGNAARVTDAKFLGQYQLVQIPPAGRGVPQIRVTFGVTSDSIWITALNETTQAPAKLIKVSK